MKKVLTAVLSLLLWTSAAGAQMPYMEEVKALGAISGQGLACGSTKFDTFEMLARAILLTKSPSERLQNEAIYAYSEAKANAYMSKEMDGFYECAAINRRFDNQDIFKAVLYGDGTIKMPDGQILTPRQPYDARMIYKKNNKVRENAKAIYNGSGEAKILKVDVKDDTVGQVRQNTAATPAPAAEPEFRQISKGYVPDYQEDGIGHISRKSR